MSEASPHICNAWKLLRGNQFAWAYAEAMEALEAGEDKECALLILAKAAHGRNMFELSTRHYEELCKAFPSNNNAKKGLKDAIARQSQQRAYRYEYPLLYEKALQCLGRVQTASDAAANLLKAEQLLEKGEFACAYDLAMKSLESIADKKSSLFILAKAAYGRRRWELSARHYEELCTASPSNINAQMGLRRANTRVRESRAGRYVFSRLYARAQRGLTETGIADYVGPIAVVDVPGKGKGIVATNDVKKGTLLLVTKAFVVVDDDLPDDALPKAVFRKLGAEPNREVSQLFDGNARSSSKPPPPGIPDIPRLTAICKFNAFCTNGHAGLDKEYSFGSKPLRGLWILPSYFNHSCLHNAHHTFYGDVMAVFATADVGKGERVTLNYVDAMDWYADREQKLKRDYGFSCDCRLCETDRADPLYQKRGVFVEGVLAVVGSENPRVTIDELERQLGRIREACASRREFKTQLYPALKTLGDAYQETGEYDRAVERLLEAVECIPASAMSVYGVRLYAQIAECYGHMRKATDARKYAQKAAELHRIRSGHDEALFKTIYADVAHLL